MSTWTVPPDPRGTPAGVVRVAVKDIIDLTGLPTTCGAKVLATAPPASADAACLAGIRAAEAAGRAAIVGKTNLHELAFGVSGVNPWFGTPVNPLDPALVPGGSSSGSAVALAAGEVDVALGTDTGGSIRIPAACCGIAGLKTTRGRIALRGVHPLAPSLDTVGPMGATLDAVATGMSLLEPGFSCSGRAPAARVGRFRIPADPEVDSAVDQALAGLAAAGVEVVDVAVPGWGEASQAVGVILMAEAWTVHGELWRTQGAELSSEVAARLEMASLLDSSEVAAAWESARQWAAELARLWDEVDLLALPVLAAAPPTLANAARVSGIRYTAPFNLAGGAALAIPAAAATAAAPVPPSLQLAGPAMSEELILATAGLLPDVSPLPGPGRS